MEIRPDLPPQVVPVAWLLGTWRGVGVGGYPTVPEFRFGQELTFAEMPGKPFLHHLSRSWLLDDEGAEVRPLAQETGYWRPEADGSLEVLLAHPTGFVEIWLGTADGGEDRAADRRGRAHRHRRRTTPPGTGSTAWSRATCCGPTTWPRVGQPLQPHLSATLKRVVSGR